MMENSGAKTNFAEIDGRLSNMAIRDGDQFKMASESTVAVGGADRRVGVH